MKISLLTDPKLLNSADANLIVLASKAPFKIPSKVDVVYIPCKDPYSQKIKSDKELFCTIDIEAIFYMYEVCNGYKDLLIYDDSGLNNSWVVMTALRLYRDNNFKETFNKCATEYPNIAPSSLWFVELFDVALNMDGEFIRLTEEYLATKQIITVGGTFFGQW